MKTALIQMPVVKDKAENLARAAKEIQRAAAAGAELVILPEMFCCPYSNASFRANAEEVCGQIYTAMADAARKAGIWLVAGSMPVLSDGKIYNTSFVFDANGRQAAFHRKVHLFDIDVKGGQRFFESETLSAGNRATVFDTPFGRLGLCICFDIRFPELARVMALAGAQAMIVPAAFNMTTGPAHWELAFRQRAVDNQFFTLGVAPARDTQGTYVSYGNSIVCDPWGSVIARAGSGEEQLLVELDFSRNEAVRRQLPLLSARRPEIYHILPSAEG